MMESIRQGYKEIEHTADWAIKAWAPDLNGLLLEAALGMTGLMEMELDNNEINRDLHLTCEDAEDLLVAFLSEILFYGESEGLGFFRGRVMLKNFHLDAELKMRTIRSQRKEIKAVTYHNLEIRKTESSLETVIVFDV